MLVVICFIISLNIRVINTEGFDLHHIEGKAFEINFKMVKEVKSNFIEEKQRVHEGMKVLKDHSRFSLIIS